MNNFNIFIKSFCLLYLTTYLKYVLSTSAPFLLDIIFTDSIILHIWPNIKIIKAEHIYSCFNIVLKSKYQQFSNQLLCYIRDRHTSLVTGQLSLKNVLADRIMFHFCFTTVYIRHYLSE